MLGRLEDRKLLGGQVIFNCRLDDRAQQMGRDRIQLDGNAGAEGLRPAVARLGRPRRQAPLFDLFRRDGDAFEDDIGIRRQFAQRLLDLLAGIDAGRIVVAEMVEKAKTSPVFGP